MGVTGMLDFFKGKRVFITGHTGFKGSWMSMWLSGLGAKVYGYSLAPATSPSLFEAADVAACADSVFGDIADFEALAAAMRRADPEVVFHLAAQPLVRASYRDPVGTYMTNVIGALNVMEAARRCPNVRVFINVTTDKCYENRETDYAYCEDDRLGGYDMYSSSKACSEILTSSYRRSFLEKGGYSLASARAGNVIGGGDWAEDRLIPDCVRAINAGKVIEIRNPAASRPWQHVLEPLHGYMLLASKVWENPEEYVGAYNFGPDSGSVLRVAEVAEQFTGFYGGGEVLVAPKNDFHEANLLKLSIEKAKKVLGWRPCYGAGQAIEKTARWYKDFYDGKNAGDITLGQIADYQTEVEKLYGRQG